MLPLFSGYGLLLIIWGILFEVAGSYAIVLLVRAMQRDERRQDELVARLLTTEPEVRTPAPIRERKRGPGSQAA
jgi:hypothetical protein